MTVYKGGCLCGAIRWEAMADPVSTFHCQCTDCRRMTGAGHASIMIFPTSAVTVTGKPRYHGHTADSGNILERGFCPECGAFLGGRFPARPETIGFTAGSLDDPALFKPQCVIFHASAAPWDHLDPALPTFPRMPQPAG